MGIGREEFRNALRHWASGVTVITTRDGAGNLQGVTVSAFSSVSLSPPLVLICIDRHTGSHHAFVESQRFIVNILGEEQQHISHQFASKLSDKFEGVEFSQTATGLPVLAGTLANLECRLVHSYKGGDHTIFIGEIEDTIVREGNPLIYYHGHYRKLENHS